MNKKNKNTNDDDVRLLEPEPVDIPTPKSRFEHVMKPVEDSYLWWHYLAEHAKVPASPPLPIRVQRKLDAATAKKSQISVSAEEYLGGEPKRYPDYATLENENFPDLFREVFDNDISSLYEAIASSKAAALYSNLMTARLQQLEKEKQKKEKLTSPTSKAYPHSKETLASYMVDIVTKYLLSSKENETTQEKKNNDQLARNKSKKDVSLKPDGSVVVRKRNAKTPNSKDADAKEEKPKRKRKERKPDENK